MALPSPQQQHRFRQLHRHIENEDDTKALHTAEEILKNDGGRVVDALKSKVVALIRLGRYEDALAFLDRTNGDKETAMVMERAYCLYRLNRYEEAAKLELSSRQEEHYQQHLVHQVKYRLKDYDDVISFYDKETDRLSRDNVERRNEIKTNQISAQILAGKASDVVAQSMHSNDDAEHSYEVLYNVGCAHVMLGQFHEARTVLQRASDLCIRTLSEDGFTKDEIDDELASIRLQMAFVHHMNGHLEKAKQQYQIVLDSKPSDKTCTAVANNNLASLKTEQGNESLFDTQRKLGSGLHGTAMKKMSPEQQRALKMNHCLLLMHMRKREACLREVEALEREFPQSDVPVIIHASLLYREHKYQEAKKLLLNFVEEGIKSNVNVVRSLLTLCQMELSKLGNAESTLALLNQMGSRVRGDLLSRPGIVGAIVSLYLKQNDTMGALHALDEAIVRCASKDSNRLYQLLLAKGDIHTRITNDHAGAVETYKRLFEMTKSGSVQYYKVLALLVDALAHVDIDMARQYASKLPSLDTADMDLEELENSATTGDQGERLLAMQMRQMQMSKEVQSMMIDDDEEEGEGGAAKKTKAKKTKKKRKNKLPKDYDPNKKPNPERWIPKSERSSAKKKASGMGSMKQMSKHQGASLRTESTTPRQSSPTEKAAATSTAVKKSSASTKKQGKSKKKSTR